MPKQRNQMCRGSQTCSQIARLAILALLIFSGCNKAERLPPSPVVAIRQGRLQGYTDQQGVFVYKGIPFAKPPVGELRWAPPVPPEPWGPDIRQATDYA